MKISVIRAAQVKGPSLYAQRMKHKQRRLGLILDSQEWGGPIVPEDRRYKSPKSDSQTGSAVSSKCSFSWVLYLQSLIATHTTKKSKKRRRRILLTILRAKIYQAGSKKSICALMDLLILRLKMKSIILVVKDTNLIMISSQSFIKVSINRYHHHTSHNILTKIAVI